MDKQPEKLWEKAFACLKDEDKPSTDPQQLDKQTFLSDLTTTIKGKRQNCVAKEWKLNRGDEVISVREIFGKMVFWINKFKEVGNMAIQYDPLHAALPWAAVRFVLEATVNEYDTNEALLEGLEYVTSLIARYAKVEDLYFNHISPTKGQLSMAIVRLYTAVLIYLARASKFYSRPTAKRVMKAALQPLKFSVDPFFQKMRAEEASVNDLARMLDAALLHQVSATMEDNFLEFHNKLDALNQEVQDLRLTLSNRTHTQQVSQEQLLAWIDAVFTDEEYERALDAKLEGTCDWIFKQSEFRDWICSTGTEDRRKILWIYGSAGFGKSILCARIIDHLRNELHKPVAYFFCSFSDELKRQPRSIVRSWAAQLIIQQKGAREIAKAAYIERKSSKATEQDLWLLLKQIHAQVKDCCLVVDGYDECIADNLNSRNHATLKSRAAFLKSLMSSIQDSKSRLLLVSRDDHDIREQLANTELSSRSYEIFRLRVMPDHTREDVLSFSKSLVEQRLSNKSEDLRNDLGLKAADKCEGMFLWVRLLHDRLSPHKNTRELQKMIFDTPAGLTQAYKRDLDVIHGFPEEDKDRAVMFLWWTLHAIRPLTVQEVTEAVLIRMNNEDTSYPVDRLPDGYDKSYVDYLRRLCGSLIDIRAPNQSSSPAKHEVQFVHFSVKEYLSESFEIHFPAFHGTSVVNTASNNELLAQQCLRYLCYDEFRQDLPSTKESFDDRIERYPFLRYAANQWDVHASRAVPLSLDTISLSNRLHDPSGARWMLYSELWLNEEFDDFTKTLTTYGDNWPAPLYFASHSGIIETVAYLLDKGVDINGIGGGYATALQKAASRGHVEVFELLMRRGADAFIEGGATGSALNAAAAPQAGPADAAEIMVPMLLSKGVEIETQDKEGWTPLHFASMSGSTKVVQLLLDAGADIDAVTIIKCTALHIACDYQHEQIVSLLLSRGADIALSTEKEEEGDGGKRFRAKLTALHIAVKEENVPMTTNLLFHGADINSRTGRGWTPLHYAAERGTEQLLEIMLENGADMNDTTDSGGTVLHIASGNGHEHAVKALLDRGTVNVNAQDRSGWTALFLAAAAGHVKIVNSLLDRDAYLEARTMDGPTALSVAAWNGHIEVVDMLLNHDADANIQIDSGWPSLTMAAFSNQVNMISLLSNHNADPNIQNNDGWTALLWAAEKGHVEIIELLLDNEADPNIQNNDGWTTLLLVAAKSHVEITKLLLDHGADPNIQNNDGWTALHFAAKRGHVESIKILLDNEADPNLQDNDGWTALRWAAGSNHVEIIKILLDNGADPNIQENDGWTALHVAAQEGHVEIIKLLLDNGADPKTQETKKNWTALHVAARHGHVEIVKLVLDNGADLNIQITSGYTALDVAKHHDREQVVEVLLQRGAEYGSGSEERASDEATSNEGLQYA